MRAAAVALALVCGVRALAQATPVYPDDSVQARETLSRVDDLLATQNLAEAARVVQALLDTEGDRVLESKDDGDVFVSVREHIHRLLLAKPALLERYRASEGPRAAKLLEDGHFQEVERSRLLTGAGLEAALRVAQLRFEAAQFEAARQTLEQIEHHPDRQGAGRVDAAAMAEKVARFLPRDDVRKWAARWKQEAGVQTTPAETIQLPSGLRSEVASPHSGGTAPDWQALPESALVSSVVARRPPRDGDDEEDELQAFEMMRQGSSRAWIMPVVVNDMVIVNNGAEISGLDRFTLSPVWSIRPTPYGRADLRRDSSRQGPPLSRLEESSWVVVSGAVGVGSMGYVTETGREGDRRLFGFDIKSGRVLWSVDPATLDRRLEGCSVRGEPVVSEGVLVVPMRRNSSVRRVSGALLAGLDLWTGELKWVRPLCSVGVMPFNRSPRAAERSVAQDGVIYRADGLGIVAAVESASGRVIWVRRMNPPGEARAYSAMTLQASNQPWAGSEPILDGTSLIALSPDSSAIIRLSALDGTMLGRRLAEDLGDATTMPSYLVRVNNRLIVVTSDRLVSLGLSDFEKSVPKTSPTLREPSMAGRVSALSNGHVLVPLEDRVLELGADDLNQIASHTLAKAGNIIALGDGVIVSDAAELHAFLKWETAEAILTKRLAAAPDDPAPALSMVNLAFRAGRYQRIVPAVDRVLDIRDRLPDSTAAQAARKRLIDSLRSMFAAGKQRWDPSTDQRAGTSAAAGGAPTVQVLSDLAQRFARGAESPAELAEYELTLGWLGEAKGAPGASLEAYGRVLSDDSLGGSMVNGEFGVPTRASEIATDRLLALVKRQGPEVYAAFAAQAARELEELGEHATAPELASLGRRYPAAPAAAIAWERLAAIDSKADRKAASVRAMALAMRAIEYSQSPKAPELARDGRRIGIKLVETLAALDRASEAARTANETARLFPGGPIAVPSAASDRLLGGNRRARFGDAVQPEIQALVGWIVAEPKITEGPGRPTDRVVLTSPGRKQVGLFVTSLTDGRLEPRWVRNYEQRQPRVIRIDQDATYVYWPAESRQDRTGGVIERIRTDGTSAWLSREVSGMLDEIEARLPDDLAPFVTPLDGSVSPGDLLVAMDGSTLVLIERVGRVLSIDLETGKPLWSTKIPSMHVYDGAISAGTLVIGGASTERPDVRVPGGRMSLLPTAIFAIDARKGGTLKDLKPVVSALLNAPDAKNAGVGDRQQVRWLRSLGAGKVLLGMYDRVVAIDAPNESVLWSYDKPAVARSLECWIVGDRAFVLNEDHAIVGLTIGDGKSPVGELDSRERIQADSSVGVVQLPDGSVAFASSRGIAVFERDGKLIGMDSGILAGEQVAQLFALGADKVAMIPDEEPDRTLDLRILALPSGKLMSSKPVALSRTPSSLHAVDGRLILTAGGVTMVLPAPVEPDALVP